MAVGLGTIGASAIFPATILGLVSYAWVLTENDI